MADPVKAAERIVRRARWLAPNDGCRGREIRTARSSLRWFDWRNGFAGRRGLRWWIHVRWTVFPKRALLLGLYTYKDEDDERCIDIGLWPFFWEMGFVDWPLPRAAATGKGDGSDG